MRFALRHSAISVVLVMACASGAGAEVDPGTVADPPAAEPAQRGTGGIEWQLTARPPTVTMAGRSTFVLAITAVNRGGATADTERDALALNVNGEDSMEFALAFGNGARDRRWAALPPGERISEERVGLAIFDGPGDYDLMLHRGERVLARLRVRVTP